MSKNKLYTLGYFRKRLKDANIESKILIDTFPQNDTRKWMISIFKDLSIICTCLKTIEGENTNQFYFCDHGQKVKPFNYILKTDSFNVIIEFLQGFKNGK